MSARKPIGGGPASRRELELWLRSPRGRRLVACERNELRRALPDVFGRHLLQIGTWGHCDELIDCAETLHHAVIGTVSNLGASAIVEAERMPIATQAVDAVVLPHTLEFTRSPHNLLREVNRILSDRGRLFIVGFNPWSVWGLRQRVGFRYRAFPSVARFYSASRVCDWLELLDLELCSLRRFSVGFPWNPPRSDGDAWSLAALTAPIAEAYVLAARKRVLPANLVGRLARAQVHPLSGMGVPVVRRDRHEQLRQDEAPPGISAP